MTEPTPKDLYDWEKAFLYDTLKKTAKWVQVGKHTGYWEVKVWATKGTDFKDSVIEEHNKQHTREEETDD